MTIWDKGGVNINTGEAGENINSLCGFAVFPVLLCYCELHAFFEISSSLFRFPQLNHDTHRKNITNVPRMSENVYGRAAEAGRPLLAAGGLCSAETQLP